MPGFIAMVSCHRLHENLQIFCRCMRQPSALSFISNSQGTGKNHLPLDKEIHFLIQNLCGCIWHFVRCVCLFVCFYFISDLKFRRQNIPDFLLSCSYIEVHTDVLIMTTKCHSLFQYVLSLTLQEKHYVISAHSCGSRPLLTCVLLLNTNWYKSGPYDL